MLIYNNVNFPTISIVKLNGGRHVVGILRGFDPFMNMVIDESIEECKDGTKNNIGMVVSLHIKYFHWMFSIRLLINASYRPR